MRTADRVASTAGWGRWRQNARMPDVTVTLVLHNSANHLDGCLASLRSEAGTVAIELVAVDNSTPDDSVEILQREMPGATLITSERNVGFAAGCNLAWPEVRGRYWLLLNPDVELEPGALEKLVRWMDDHPRVGAGSPWFREPGLDAPINPGRAFPSISTALLELSRLHRLLGSGVRGRLLQGSYLHARDAGEAPMADWIPGTAMIVRSEAVRDAGPLNEAFFVYGEDLEFCWRLRRCGWEIRTSPAAAVLHHESSSSTQTWTRETVNERIASEILRACEMLHGRTYARAYARLMTLALALEARHPGRRPERRERASAACRAWRRAASGQSRG
jgi:N-acetylglucosaminyl-diphospho-decaprenol L-rhamnosyltransferase